MHRLRPIPTLLTCVILLLFYSNWRTAKQLSAEKAAHQKSVQAMRDSFWGCQPSVFLSGSTNPIDAVGLIDYRDASFGRACVFLADGRYGLLWYSKITEAKEKAHLEWQFQELGKYKW